MFEHTSLISRFFRRIMLAFALLVSVPHLHAADDFLPPEEAFKFSAKMLNPKTITVSFVIADGYYMYRERFAFKAEGAVLGKPEIPPGKIKFDETFQKNVEAYRSRLTITVPVEAKSSFTLKVTSQGCADKGLCYAPMESTARLNPKGGSLLDVLSSAQGDMNGGSGLESSQASAQNSASTADASAVQSAAPADSEMGRIESALKSGKLLAIAPLFILLGLGLAFTPCVLPMVPILSSLIVGEGRHVSRKRGLALAGAYSLGMAIVYTALGIAAGLAGKGLSADLQHPVLLTTFAVLMVILSLAMFGVYQLQMPMVIQTRLMALSEKQATGRFAGVFVMGILSALIVGPCVAAPLAGVLLYISQTRDVLVGGSALFSMAVGMSLPLLLVGMSAGTLLPRSGAWMEEVKRFFGILMLGTALWIISPVLPPAAQLAGWALLASGYAIYLLWSRPVRWLGKTVGILFGVLGLLQFAGLATGAQDPLAPLAKVLGSPAKHAEFTRIKSLAELEQAIRQANGKLVMLDFYADWCVSCKEMEKFTFSDPGIQKRFADMVLVQADVTANNDDDKALLKHFKLFGPPGIIFFDRQGNEIPGARVIGYQNAEKFSQSLKRVQQS